MVFCCRIFKEKTEGSPGIILIGHGLKNANPSEASVNWLTENDWKVVFLNVGVGEARLAWLDYPCCLGGTVLDRNLFESIKLRIDPAEKFILCDGNQDGLSYRTISSAPKRRGRTHLTFSHLERQYDICDITTTEDRKRHDLFVRVCKAGPFKGYLFVAGMNNVPVTKDRIVNACRECGYEMQPFRFPGSDVECLQSSDENLFIDARTWEENCGFIANVLDSTKVWVHLSTMEGLPESMREALMRDVPVIVASDLQSQIMGGNREPLFGGRFKIGEICVPEPETVAQTVRSIIAKRNEYQPRKGLIASGFSPLALNREITCKSQAIFEQKGWPWRGVSLGLTAGTNYSDIDLSKPIPPEILHKGFGDLLWDESANYDGEYEELFGDPSEIGSSDIFEKK